MVSDSIRWRPFFYRGEEFDLSHTHPFEHKFQLAEVKPGDPGTCDIRVVLSHHVFTKAPENGRSLNPELYYQTPFQSERKREFSFDRYRLSKTLPRIIKEIDKYPCKQTPHNNYLRVEFLDVDGEQKEYEIYFSMRKARRGLLNLRVESAYVRDVDRSRPNYRNMRFHIIVRNTLRGK